MALYSFIRLNPKFPICMEILNYSNFAKQQEYKKCYQILGIPENSDQEQIRIAYLKLVKRFHPDSGTNEADANKFYQIDRAFRMLLTKKSRERWGVGEEIQMNPQEQDIKHTAAQHRHYLSFDGVGSGTPFQRQKQYTKVRAMQAADNVLKHRIDKVTAEEKTLMVKTPLKHKINTKYGFDRLVEDLIQESMSRGEFNNLSGCGKPLPVHQNRNPYVDLVTHKLNEVLIDNGFTPEWITLQKEIREDIQMLRDGLLMERSYFGPYPLNTEENNEWKSTVEKYERLTQQINNKINKYNLVVPVLNKQMLQIELEKETQKVIKNGKNSVECNNQNKINRGNISISSKHDRNDGSVNNIFGIFDALFRK